MRIFSVGQDRTRVFGPRNAGQEVVHQVCRNQKPAKNEVQQKKTIYGWTLFSYHPGQPHGQWRVKGNNQQIDEQQC